MILTALLMGLVGSMHCATMCSPLAVAVTSYRNPSFWNRLIYNMGRILSYGILGAIISSFGSLFNFPVLQNIFSFVLGCALIIFGVIGITHFKIPFITKSLQQISTLIKTIFKKFIIKKTRSALFGMGMINGLLPCGLTYLALSYCILLPSTSDGFVFMLLFGLGTFPVMLGLTSVIQYLFAKFHLTYQKITTITLITLGALLISRTLFDHVHSQDKNVANAGVTLCE
ncbi:MAG: sulfite exporter TauE/SafE family protein [Cyclobacteriaceae bacterium]|nr:sulfite exporter TauE/SafE family protein [Cyclobacteriaceae bacterium]